MFLHIQEKLRAKLSDSIQKHFHLNLPTIVLEHPPKLELGDLAAPLAFELAKQLKQATGTKHNPRQLAEQLKADVLDLPELDRVEVAGAGYLNFFLKRDEVFLCSLSPDGEPPLQPQIGGKLIVEHTSVNPNKAAHIGHIRNAVLGDTLVRLLKACGEDVETQNYIDNTGVQVVDVVIGFVFLEEKSLADIQQIEGKFDYYCWDLYARVGQFYEADPERKKLREQVLHEIESGQGEIAGIADYVAMRVLQCHLDTMERLGIRYDVMPRESEVLHMHLWDAAFERLKASGSIIYETSGRNKGCWVMKAEQSETTQDEESEHDADKILVRSNGTVNYTGKDIAYHLWKLGQLDLEFHYKPFHTYPDGKVVWITTPTLPENAAELPARPAFGNGSAYFNVIDVGQSYTQEYVKKGVLAALVNQMDTHRVERSAHLSYEKVALTPNSCDVLGFELDEEERKRTIVSMSGRKGLGVKADDLLDRLETSALVHVTEHQATLPPEEQKSPEAQQAMAHTVAVGALRYFLLKYTRGTIIAFDFKEALKEQGETGIYLQFAAVRINSIYRKANRRGISTDDPLSVLKANPEKLQTFFTGEDGQFFWGLTSLSLQLNEVLVQAAEFLEPAQIAKYAFQIAQTMSSFLNKYHVLGEADPVRQQFYLALLALVRRQLQTAMHVMGIDVPEQM